MKDESEKEETTSSGSWLAPSGPDKNVCVEEVPCLSLEAGSCKWSDGVCASGKMLV